MNNPVNHWLATRQPQFYPGSIIAKIAKTTGSFSVVEPRQSENVGAICSPREKPSATF